MRRMPSRSPARRLLPVALLTTLIAGVPGAAVGVAEIRSEARARVSSAEPKPREPARAPTYRGRACPDPVGHTVTQCRLGVHGAPDLSRRRWAQLFGRELTISEKITSLVANAGAGGEPDWPLVDSLAQPMGRLRYDPAKGRFRLTALDGTTFSVVALNTRGHGCAASAAQSKGFMLVQIIAPKAPSHGTQAFLDARALDPASTAYRRFASQRGGGTGCGPARPERGRVRPLRDPAVGATAHARLSNGVINTVTEYDAKAPFGGTVYVMTNTTSVRVGGITRSIVRVGTPVATVDRFRRCDPNSDGTLTWRYVAIHTGHPARPRIYGWIPARCR